MQRNARGERQFHQHDLDGANRDSGRPHNLVDGNWRAAKCFEHCRAVAVLGSRQRLSLWARGIFKRWLNRSILKMLDNRVQRRQDILNFGYQDRAVLKQLVGALGTRIERMARHCEHVASLLSGETGRDQRAGPLCRFNDDRASGQTRYDPIASREVLSAWLKPRWLFAHNAAVAADFCMKLGVLGWIDVVGPAS